MKKKLWIKIFLQIAAVFAAFIVVLTVSNSVFLVPFFKHTEKLYLREQGAVVKSLDFSDNNAVVNKLSEIAENFSFETEIYTDSGKVVYTSYGSQMLDFYYRGNSGFSMNHKSLKTLSSETRSDGSVFETAVDSYTDTEYLVYRLSVSDGMYAELRVQTRLLKNSAETAGMFVSIIAFICLAAALVWTFFSARHISRPIAEMSEITRDMARLNFDRRVKVDSADEIGELGNAINALSENLKSALDGLRKTNERLEGEIELERQLDVMRRGFVANVSHELKTPISIIQGYAEGLKLNINSDARERYCDTIIDESNRMNKLVLGLLQLSRYESGQMPLSREKFSLSQMARDMLLRIFEGTDITCVFPENEVFAFADPTQTEQLFGSILENARAHVNSGGTVEVKLAETENETKVEIFNTGSHVDEEKMPQIWQSFFRGEESHKRNENRFGLGLSIVSAICRVNGKKCGVYNTENGVCFWFTVDGAANCNEKTVD